MRRQDREATRGKLQEDRKGARDDNASRDQDRMKGKQVRGGATPGESQPPQRPSGRMPIPD